MMEVRLSQNKTACVDDIDFERVNKINWSLKPEYNGNFYAVTTKRWNGKKHTIQMHRFILKAPKGTIIDHINHNGLDNRRCNLRFATTQTNAFNRNKPSIETTSKYKGVLRRHGKGKWIARIRFNNIHLELGQYMEEGKAASVYNYASRIMFGNFRKENIGNDINELSHEEKKMVYIRCKRYIDKYGWFVNTEEYHSFL